MSRPDRSPVPVALIGALVLALSLAACGRKGPLDPPPGGYQVDHGAVRTPTSAKGSTPKVEQPEYDENGRPIAPTGKTKKLPFDWLID